MIRQILLAIDWGVSYQIFDYLNSLWGPFEVDWFASDSNNKVDKFYSRYWYVKCSGIDAFTEVWYGKKGWFCPPIYLVARVLAKIKEDKAFGCLVIPMWKSANYWLNICPDGVHFNTFIKSVIYLPTEKNLFSCVEEVLDLCLVILI
jgi:hypothetical protein